MATVNDLEQRVQRLEEELASLKQRFSRRTSALRWFDHLSGSMEDMTEFDEVVQLGAEFRRSQRDSYTVPPTGKQQL